MTYLPETNEVIAGVTAVAFAKAALNTTSSTVGSVINFDAVDHAQGASFLTLSSGSMVLPAGHWYYIEATAQVVTNDGVTLSANDWAKTQLKVGGFAVSNESLNAMYYRSDQNTAESRDEKCVALIDAMSGDVTLDFILTARSGQVSAINATNRSTHWIYAGFGRALVMQLEAP
jgi:hypothetical protein